MTTETLAQYCDEKEKELIAVYRKCTTEECKDVTQKALAIISTIRRDWGECSVYSFTLP